jgi:hypothetical protein
VQDEWGLFDPDQAGFAAVLRRVREIAGEPPPTQHPRKTRNKVRSAA